MNVASSRRNWPTGRGFERFYGFLGAETNQWYPELVYDSHPVDPPRSPEEGYHFTEDITDKALEFIKDAKVLAPDKPFFLYYAPGACHAPHHAPKEWIDRFKGRFDMGYEAMREQTLARQKETGHRPAEHRAAAAEPDRHARDAHRAERRAVPRAGLHAAVGLAVGRRAAAVLPHGRGLRRLPGAHRRADRAAAGLPRGDRPAREHDRRPGLRQRRQRRGRPQRVGQREQALQRDAGRHRGEPRDARRPRRPEDLQPLPQRLGDGVQHAVQDVEALRVQRRHVGPLHDLVARRHPGHGRAPRAVPPRDRPRPDDPRRARRRAARDDRRARAEPLRRHQHALQLRRRARCPAPARRSSTRCSARAASGTTAGRPSPPTPRSAAGATSTRTRGSSTTPTSTAPSCTTSPPPSPSACRS